RLQFTQMAPYRWHPAINAFQCDKGLRVCVDLAGVDLSQGELIVHSQRLAIRGTREAPEPTDDEGRAVQMIAFEIDYGPFERVVELPLPVDVAQVQAAQRHGFLWIELPFKK